jgi:hypothetical protein
MRYRWKWISALTIAAALGFGLWLRQRPGPPIPVPIAAAPAPAPLTSPWPARTSNAAVEAPKQGDHSDEIEVCGVGKVKLNRDDWTATGNYLDALTRNSRMRWLAALRNSDEYRTRATGLYLEGIFDRDSPQKDPEAARDELVQLAVGTKDPAAFALAYTKCLKGVEDSTSQGACPQLSLDDWTRADADNAVPWLQLAAKARREHDLAAEAAAVAQAAHAHQYETYNWSLFSFAQSVMPNDVTAADRWILTTQIIGVEAAMPMPYLPLSQYCSRELLTDAAVHQQCNALVELMVNKARTLLEFAMGKALGARVGWPVERVDELTQELHASMQAFKEAVPQDAQQQWSCDSVASGNAFMSQWDELGERGLARQVIERSGETVAELSRKYDEQMATTMRENQMREIPESPQGQAPAPQP